LTPPPTHTHTHKTHARVRTALAPHRYLGIPYASPPTAELRFRAPIDWFLNFPSEKFMAQSFGASCTQFGGQLYNATSPGVCATEGPHSDCSEDCLTLNVWKPSPGSSPSSSSTASHYDRQSTDVLASPHPTLHPNQTREEAGQQQLAPIFVWVHGGGYTQGGSSEFNGSTLAAQHGVVVVALNYRLGPLGFLAYEGLEARPPAPSGC
jgi:para-nitrobenzyl esterase